MSEWITDRLPTDKDSDSGGCVWSMYNGEVVLQWSHVIDEGTPWMPISKPEPYVAPKPKRWNVVWSDFRECWALRECKFGAQICLRDDTIHCGLINRCDKDREAAERVAAIYNEVMP